MKLSTRSRYGLRLMFELALFNGKGTVLPKQTCHTVEGGKAYQRIQRGTWRLYLGKSPV